MVYGSTTFVFKTNSFYIRSGGGINGTSNGSEIGAQPLVVMQAAVLAPETVQKGLTAVGTAISIDFLDEFVEVVYPVFFQIFLLSSAGPLSTVLGASRRLLVYQRVLLSAYAGVQVGALL